MGLLCASGTRGRASSAIKTEKKDLDMGFIKKVIIFAILGGALYFLLSYHFVLFGRNIKLLKKSELTLKYTIYNTSGRAPESILKVEPLYRDGIGELLVEMGVMSEENLKLYKQIRSEKEES